MRLASLFLTGALSLCCAAALSGCATGSKFPDAGVVTLQSDLGTFHGSNYGGHAPIIGAHLFVLQAGTGGYGTAATSLLTASYPATGTAHNYPTAKDTTAGSVTQGDYYVTTDLNGAFYLSGDYTCTAGLPVYLYAAGGTSASFPSTPIASFTADGTKVTFTVPVGITNLLSVGQQVTFAGLSGAVSSLLGFTYTVSASTLTSFSITNGLAIGAGPTGGAAMPTLINNPAITNMAVLGNCPSSGAANFSYLTYVYVNEVSTVAAAYSLSGFFSNSATSLVSTDAAHLAIPLENGNSATSPAWVGIQNAANNAAQLYSIQGKGPAGTSGDGEEHGANVTTPNGGTVPAALINAIANALASCVDSGNTAVTATIPCITLLADTLASSTTGGVPLGALPKDTATVAINMAHNPWNSNAQAIINLAGTLVPYLPTVGTVSDLAIGISYPVPHQAGNFGAVAIDAGGNAWVTAFGDPAVMKLSPLGTVLSTNTYAATIPPGCVAIDSKGDAWVGIRDLADFPDTGGSKVGDGVYEYTNAGVPVTGSPFLNTGTITNLVPGDNIELAIDGSDSVYLANHPYSNILELSAAGVETQSYTNDTYATNGPYGVALDGSANIWTTSNKKTNSIIEYKNAAAGGSLTTPVRAITNVPNPEGLALDANGNVWVSDASNNDIYEIKPGATTATQVTGGGAAGTVGMAVDGAGLVFAANPLGGANGLGSISVFSNAAVPLTGSGGFNGSFTTATAQTPLIGPYFIALDASGNLWTMSNTAVVEYLGVATPVLTPLSAAVKAGTLAATP